MDKVLDEVKPLLGNVLNNTMPDITGPSLPVPSKPTLLP